MAVKIRLKRVGKKKAPSYRVVIADARSPRDGRIIDNIGWYNPLVDDPAAVQVREVRNDRSVLALELHVAPDDFGKVIGRQGRVAKAMRTLLRAGGTREGRHTSLEIL